MYITFYTYTKPRGEGGSTYSTPGYYQHQHNQKMLENIPDKTYYFIVIQEFQALTHVYIA